MKGHGVGRRSLVLRTALLAGAVGLALSAPGEAAAKNRGKAATVCPRGCEYTAIQPAIDAAPEGGTISVGPGVYRGGVTVDKRVVLVGAGARRTLIAGAATSSVIEAFTGSIDVSGVTITGGLSGITVTFGHVTLRDSIVSGNASGAGGFSGSISILDSLITRNTGAALSGIFIGSFVLKDSIVSRNGSGLHGNSRMTLSVADSTITRNSGSGIAMAGGDLEVSGSVISRNTADYGGGIRLTAGRAGASAEIVDSTIRHNTASVKGGGVFLDVLTGLTLRDSRVFKNSARSGGGIYNGGAWATWYLDPNFVSIASRIWNNSPEDYLAECDASVWTCEP